MNCKMSNKDLEYNNFSEKKMKNFNSVISTYNKSIFLAFLFSIQSCTLIFFIILCIILYFLNIIEIYNCYSIWFNIVFLFVTLITTLSIFYHQNRVNFQGIESNSSKKLFHIRQEGISKTVREHRLACGDVIKLAAGDVVPADIRITECSQLQITNCNLSNQKFETDFICQPTHENILKSKDILFQGSLIINGNVSGIVINANRESFLNRALKLIASFFNKHCLSHKSIFINELINFLFILCLLWFGINVVCILFLIRSGYKSLQLVYISIGLGSSLLSPTFVMVVLFGLSITRKQFSKCVLKTPELSVTVGQINLLFVNDISLFFQNKFIISRLWLNGHPVSGELAISEECKVQQSFAWTALTRASILCNDAYQYYHVRDDRSNFDIDESLLRSFNDCESVKKWGGCMSVYKQNNICLFGPKYDSISNCKLSIHKLNDGDSRLLLVLRGNPIDILQCCSTILIDGKEENINLWRSQILDYYEKSKEESQFIKAFCDYRLNPEIFSSSIKNFDNHLDNQIPRTGLRFVGIISFNDSVNRSMLSFVEQCNECGIRLVINVDKSDIPSLSMNTELKLMKHFHTISEAAMNSYSNNMLIKMIENKNLIICENNRKRVQDLIELCQLKQNRIVGVIENDIEYLPNLLSANVGISTQSKANNLCKQISDLSVTDDDFLSLVQAIKLSRQIFRLFKVMMTMVQYPKLTLLFGFLSFTFLGVPLVINLNFILAFELCFLVPTICIFLEKLSNKNDFNTSWKFIDFMLVLEIGSIQLAGSIFSFIVVMTLHGFWPRRLFMIRNSWYLNTVNSISDSYGQEWTYSQRMNLNLLASSTVFVTLCVLQIVAILITGTNFISKSFRCFRNYKLVLSIIYCLAFVAIIVYGLSLLRIVEFCSMELVFSLFPLSFALYMIVFVRIRHFITGKFLRT